jgi:hypothetical protein
MRKTIRRPLWEQPDLFRPTPQRPTWRTLPNEVRQKILQLLARLTRKAHNRSDAQRGVAAKEVGDE